MHRDSEVLPADEVLAGISDGWNSESRLKCYSYCNLIGLSSFVRYTLGITVERITGNVNHGNRKNESLWDYREGESKQYRSPYQAGAQQKQSSQEAEAELSSQPQALLGKEAGLFTCWIFPKAAQQHAERAHGLSKTLEG